MSFVNQFKRMSNMTTTENGGLAYKSTGSDLLSLFANIGGMRDRNDSDIISAWKLARKEDKLLADNLILYSRDIRNAGLGERRIGRLLLKELAMVDPRKVERNLQKIVDAGRWDDLFVFEGTPAWDETVRFIQNQFRTDVNGMKKNEPISLLAKWLPSINASSEKTKRLARIFCTLFSLTPRTYRKSLSAMRKYIDVVERKMSAGQWNEINFETVPSVAMSRYIATYNKRCQERFAEYKASLEKGEAKVNAATLYPYNLVQSYISQNRYGRQQSMDTVTKEQWKALPNYVNGEFDVVCVCDTSGSMMSNNYQPISTAVGLGIYFAQRNKGAFHNLFMTFSSNPTIQKIQDNWELDQCVDYVLKSDWGMSTNLDKSFKLIYDIAVKAHEAPKAIAILSDMEIDAWGSKDMAESITEKWNKKFVEAGLECPKLIYWNIESRHGNVLSQCTDNVAYCSGYGIGSFKFFQTLIDKSAVEAMMEILTQPAFCWK